MLGWWILTWQVSLNPTELTQYSWARWCHRSDRQTYPVLGVFTMVWGIQSSFLAREVSRSYSRMCFSVFNTSSFQKKLVLVQKPSLYATLTACSHPCLVQTRASMRLCIQLLYVVGLTFSVAIHFTLCSVNVCDNKGKMGKGGWMDPFFSSLLLEQLRPFSMSPATAFLKHIWYRGWMHLLAEGRNTLRNQIFFFFF